jgi:A/G-specific adenine glycosylase
MARRKETSRVDLFVSSIRDWSGSNMRRFSFRRSIAPYDVLLAELLLRKTTASQVDRVYPRLIERYADPFMLAKARQMDLSNLLAPLGIHSRGSAMIDLARKIVDEHSGIVPSRKEDLLCLPGVGPYTCAVVRTFCFGKKEGMVDTNVARILTRYFGYRPKTRRAHNDPQIALLYAQLLEHQNPRLFHFGILDYCSSICKARNPNCLQCRMRTKCEFSRRLNRLGKS